MNSGITILQVFDRGDKECYLSAKKKKEATCIAYRKQSATVPST